MIKMENKEDEEYKKMTYELAEKIFDLINGNNIFIAISALMVVVEELIGQIDDDDDRNWMAVEAIKHLNQERVA
jgi:CRISPR/Cas system CSM-associated protein Csm2 small subunit